MTWLARFSARSRRDLDCLRHNSHDVIERMDAHLRDSARGHGLTAYRAAVKADPALAAATREHLDALTDGICERCYISRRTRQHLLAALS